MTTVAHPGALTPAQARTMFREGTSQPTGGWCAAYTQVNLISVPSDWAHDVHMFCRQNPKPCPVLDIADLGSWNTALAPGADLRTDLPLYHVWEHGRLIAEQTDVVDLWREDLVTFLIGCSFTFESALTDAGVPLRHVSQGANVAMYVTDHECRPGGRLRGPLVVSMRQVPAGLVDTATSGDRPDARGARRPGPYRRPGGPGHPGLRPSGLRRPGSGRAGRCAHVLGVRRHSPGSADGIPAAVRDHSRAGAHADHRCPGHGLPRWMTPEQQRV